MDMKRSMRNAYNLLIAGHLWILMKTLGCYLYSNSVAFGLRRDIKKPFSNPDARIPISIRPIRHGDIEQLTADKELNNNNPRLVANQKALVEEGIKDCFVAVTQDDTPAYMQCLIHNNDNDKIQHHFGNIFPILNDDEALLEGAFMSPDFRGQRIMPAAMSRIAAKARQMEDIRWVLTFVTTDNIPSLKGCMRSGFEPYVLRREKCVLFTRTVTFEEIPPDVMEQYKQDMDIND